MSPWSLTRSLLKSLLRNVVTRDRTRGPVWSVCPHWAHGRAEQTEPGALQHPGSARLFSAPPLSWKERVGKRTQEPVGSL